MSSLTGVDEDAIKLVRAEARGGTADEAERGGEEENPAGAASIEKKEEAEA